MPAKPRIIGYWVATGLLAVLLLASGAAELASAPAVVASTLALGYPAYSLTILGVWKVLGAIVLLAPRFPRLTEWAYAGIFFDFTGAAASHAFSGDPAGRIVTPLVMLAIAAASWALRPPSRAWRSDAALPKRAEGVASPEDVAARA